MREPDDMPAAYEDDKVVRLRRQLHAARFAIGPPGPGYFAFSHVKSSFA